MLFVLGISLSDFYVSAAQDLRLPQSFFLDPLILNIFLSQQKPILCMKPCVFCKELQCKHILSFAILAGLSSLLSENFFF